MSFDVGSLLASLVISSIGFVAYRYGKSQQRLPQRIMGIVLMVYPYFVSDMVWMIVVAIGLLALLWLLLHLGY